LRTAPDFRADSRLGDSLKNLHRSWDTVIGKDIEHGFMKGQQTARNGRNGWTFGVVADDTG